VTGGTDLRSGCAALFSAELNPVLRRLGERSRGAGPHAPVAAEDAVVRAHVWAALADLGAFGTGRLRALTDVAELAGAALYASPLADTLTAIDLIGDAAQDAHLAAAAQAATGRRMFALAVRGPGRDDVSGAADLRVDQEGTLSAVRRFVAFAADVDDLCVIGRIGTGTVLARVAANGPGVRTRRHDDIGRGDLYEVECDRAPLLGGLTDVTATYPAALARARIRHAAYLAGAAAAAVEVTCEYLRQRQAFGQPLAKFQAPAFRLAAHAATAAAVGALARSAADDADAGLDVTTVAAQVLFLAADLVREAAADAVHLHGAYGMTEACDAQVFYRRAAVDACWLGTPTELRTEAAAGLAAAARTGIPG
jgi:alkylation response protein AidB-like acyl-CoA dehydrogenase